MSTTNVDISNGKLEMLNVDQELENLSHEDLCEITQSSLRRIIAADCLLNDLPGDVTTDEVLSQIAVIQGQYITVTVLRYQEKPLSVVIPQEGTTVLEFKKAIQRAFALVQQRSRSKSKISWKYVWKCYNLKHDGEVLSDNMQTVAFYGVHNHSRVHFVKRLHMKNNMPLSTNSKL